MKGVEEALSDGKLDQILADGPEERFRREAKKSPDPSLFPSQGRGKKNETYDRKQYKARCKGKHEGEGIKRRAQARWSNRLDVVTWV